MFQSVDALYPELSRTDLFVQVPEVKIPVYFCLGRHDYEVPSVIVGYFSLVSSRLTQFLTAPQIGYADVKAFQRLAVSLDVGSASDVSMDTLALVTTYLGGRAPRSGDACRRFRTHSSERT